MSSCSSSVVGALDVGTTANISVSFVFNNELTDPASVTLTVVDPNKVESTPVVTQAGAGQYYADIEVGTSGQWFYKWNSTMPKLAEQGSFVVRKALF